MNKTNNNYSKAAKIPFTLEEYQRMQAEVKKITDGRDEIVNRLQAAREMGDLSENGAYKYAKFELRSTDSRIRHLTKLLENGEVKSSTHSGMVDFGSRVTLDNGKQQQSFTLVSHLESNPQKQKLSLDSPLGKTLIGKKVGDQVEITAPAGTLTYKILKIE